MASLHHCAIIDAFIFDTGAFFNCFLGSEAAQLDDFIGQLIAKLKYFVFCHQQLFRTNQVAIN